MAPSDFSAAIRALDHEAKLALLDELWRDLSEEVQRAPVPDDHREELDRRLDRADGEGDGVASWDEVRRRITGSHP